MNVNLDDREWQAVMQILSQQPWHVANPLLMKIGEQLQQQTQQSKPSTNSGLHSAEKTGSIEH